MSFPIKLLLSLSTDLLCVSCNVDVDYTMILSSSVHLLDNVPKLITSD